MLNRGADTIQNGSCTVVQLTHPFHFRLSDGINPFKCILKYLICWGSQDYAAFQAEGQTA